MEAPDDRLLPGESPISIDLEDIAHWISVYSELVDFLWRPEIPGTGGDPMAGRRWPSAAGEESRGLWVANQLCDLVELRSFRTGAVARLRMVA